MRRLHHKATLKFPENFTELLAVPEAVVVEEADGVAGAPEGIAVNLDIKHIDDGVTLEAGLDDLVNDVSGVEQILNDEVVYI